MKSDYLKGKLEDLDDEAFIEIIEGAVSRSAKVEEKRHDDLVHITEISDEIEQEYKDWGKPKGVMTGYPSLDQRIGGLGQGHVILIGGETSNGKSALATNIAVNVAKASNGGLGVLYITLEMLQRELGARIRHINGTVDDLNIMFQKEFRITHKDVEPIFLKAKSQGAVELVVLDYMQYLGRGMTLEEVARMSKEMKSLALKYEVPFIVIVSLRKGEGGKAKRKWTEIEIEDFMGTGSIGYDCDVAMIASRKNMENEYEPHSMFVKVLKTRNAELDYNNRYVEFVWNKTKITEPTKDFTEGITGYSEVH